MNDKNLTPTEDLFLEVLAARTRLGHGVWTFDVLHKRVARSLEERGLIGWKSGVVERTILAWLTDDGRSLCLHEAYVPPILGGEM